MRIETHHLGIGKASFSPEQISDNVRTLVSALLKAKPASSKGVYLRSVSLSSTMGLGISIDTAQKFVSAAI